MPDISIILPVYNTGKYLEECVTSLLGQTFNNLEIIAINDGSTDDSLHILQRHAARDPRLRIFNQENRGIGFARGLALSKARGKYIMFCDGDDQYEPNMCQRMKDTLEQTGSDMVACDCFIEEEDKMHGRSAQEQQYYRLSWAGDLTLDVEHRLSTNVILWNKIFRRDIIEKNHITIPPFKEHDDTSFTMQYLFSCKRIYGLPEQLYRYRLRADSLMGHFFGNKQGSDKWRFLAAWNYTVKWLIEQKQWPAVKTVFSHVFFDALEYLQRVFSWKEFSLEDLKRMATFVQDLPLTKQGGVLEKQLYSLQQGNYAQFPRSAQGRKIKIRLLGNLVYKIYRWDLFNEWLEKLTVCGLQIYKYNYLTQKKRLFGVIPLPK